MTGIILSIPYGKATRRNSTVVMNETEEGFGFYVWECIRIHVVTSDHMCLLRPYIAKRKEVLQL